MPYIQFNDQRFALTAAELSVGAYDGAAVRLPGDDPALRAILLVGADGTGLVRRGSADAVVGLQETLPARRGHGLIGEPLRDEVAPA